MNVPPFPRKRRRRNTLDATIIEERYENNTLTTSFGCQEAFEKTPEIIRCKSKNGSKTIRAYWSNMETSQGLHHSFHLPEVIEDYSEIPGFYIKRRDAICFLFQSMGSPVEDMWVEEGIVSDIMHRLSIKPSSRSSVMVIMKDVLEANSRNEIYNPKANMSKRGHDFLINEFDDSAKSLYNSISTGCGIPTAADILNVRRQRDSLPAISFSAVANFSSRSKIIVKTLRKVKKSGKSDANSDWAKARTVQSDQLLKALGKRPLTPEEVADGTNTIIPFTTSSCVFWDEKHKEQVYLFSNIFSSNLTYI